MKLGDFVRETIVEIVRGVSEADAQVKSLAGIVNPPPRGSQGLSHIGSDPSSPEGGVRRLETVTFDVAVTVSSETGTRGGIAVVAGFLGAASEGRSSKGLENVSRVKFGVPVALPVGVRSAPAPEL